LAEKFKKEDSVRIAKVDISKPSNRIEGWPVPGTPYLVLFPANYKQGIIFREHRSLNSLIEFIIEHAGHPIDVPIHYTSQAAPAKQEGPVVEVVGSTWKEIVMDPNVDVFINFYAPWCPFSQRLSPVWDQLGDRLKSQRDKIVVAKMDGTANEVPGLHIHAFPTITLYQAGTKMEFSYRGQRTVEALLDHAQQNAERSFQDPVTGKWSHEVPKEYKEHAVDVIEVTDENYDQVIGDRSKNVVAMYYADWDPHSQELFGLWTTLAQEYAQVEMARVVQMNAAKSKKAKIALYPTIMLHPAKRATADEGTAFKGKEKTLTALKDWISDKAEKNRVEEVLINQAKVAQGIVPANPGPPTDVREVRQAVAMNTEKKFSPEAEVLQSIAYKDPEDVRLPKKEL